LVTQFEGVFNPVVAGPDGVGERVADDQTVRRFSRIADVEEVLSSVEYDLGTQEETAVQLASVALWAPAGHFTMAAWTQCMRTPTGLTTFGSGSTSS